MKNGRSLQRTSRANALWILIVLAFTAAGAGAQTRRARPLRAKTAAGASTTTSAADATPKYKGIWEPMNYPDDVQLDDVYFANDKIGWVSGKGTGGFILHTLDGGAHWDLQVGDPHSNDQEVIDLRFLDASHGWAVQGSQLIRTTDGKTWETVGPFAPNSPLAEYRFTTPQDGFEVAGYYSGSTIFATHDGGRNWKPVYQCATTLQVNGLSRNVSCFLRDVSFPSPQVGYSVGGGFNDPWATIVKTVDGGATWKVIFASTDIDTISGVFFTDENHGVIRLHDSRVFFTSDGGQSWHGGTGSAEATMKFADPQVGLSCNLRGNPSCSYTLDSGKSWTTRTISFPTDIFGYSLPRRDRAYVVGDHGMIYRYRVMPADYTAKGILDAPLMPAYGFPILGHLQDMKAQVAELQQKLASTGGTPSAASAGSPAAPTSAATGDGSSDAAASATSGSSSAAVAAAPSSVTIGASESNVAASATTGDSTGDGSAAAQSSATTGSGQSGAAVPPADQSASAGSGGFVQDTSNVPPSTYVQDCCAAQVQNMQTSFSSFAQQVPAFSSNNRNLNLLFVGLNMLSDLMGRAKQIRDAFVALKKSTDPQTALAALSNLANSLETTSQAINTGFQNITAPSVTAGAVNALSGVPQGIPTPAAGTSPDPNASPNATTTAAPTPAAAATTTTTDQLKKAAKKIKIPWR